ncbi:MAG: hypothetical protein ACFFH0_10710 [Promethearchaeota archaeon]
MTRRKTKNKLIHRWVEPQCEKIEEPFNIQILGDLLGEGFKNSGSKYSHQQIADWCRRWFVEVVNERMDVPESVCDIIQDIDAQWDLFLFNTYTYEDLIQLDLSKVRLPVEWFAGWAIQLKNLTEQLASQGFGPKSGPHL